MALRAVKYPLTPEAKLAAEELVKEWDAGRLQQSATFTYYHGDGYHYDKDDGPFELIPPPLSILRELSLFNLIRYDVAYTSKGSKQHNILLLQELRNAVVYEFTVSDYFLTLNAVGNIIVNSMTGPVQGVGYSEGDVTLTMSGVADKLEAQLGADLIKSNADLKEAIDNLRTAGEDEQGSRLGKVVERLAFYMDLGANTVQYMPALIFAVAQLRIILGI